MLNMGKARERQVDEMGESKNANNVANKLDVGRTSKFYFLHISFFPKPL